MDPFESSENPKQQKEFLQIEIVRNLFPEDRNLIPKLSKRPSSPSQNSNEDATMANDKSKDSVRVNPVLRKTQKDQPKNHLIVFKYLDLFQLIKAKSLKEQAAWKKEHDIELKCNVKYKLTEADLKTEVEEDHLPKVSPPPPRTIQLS